MRSCCSLGAQFQLGKMNILEMHDADGCTTIGMYIMPKNYRLKNSFMGVTLTQHAQALDSIPNTENKSFCG